MSNINTLTGTKIQETYPRLLQIVGGELFNGEGVSVTLPGSSYLALEEAFTIYQAAIREKNQIEFLNLRNEQWL